MRLRGAERPIRRRLNVFGLSTSADEAYQPQQDGCSTERNEEGEPVPAAIDVNMREVEQNDPSDKRADHPDDDVDQDARAGLYARIAHQLHDNPMAIYLANDVSIYGVGPRATGWKGPTGRDFLIPTNISLQ